MLGAPFNFKVNPKTLYPASTLAGLHVRQSLPACQKVWMIGTAQMREEL